MKSIKMNIILAVTSLTYLIGTSFGELTAKHNSQSDRIVESTTPNEKLRVFIESPNASVSNAKETFASPNDIVGETAGIIYIPSNSKEGSCSSTEKKECEKLKRNCNVANTAVGYICDKCLDQYIENDKKECVEHCSKGTPSEIDCNRQKKKCKVSKGKNYECGECLERFNTNGTHCVEPCSNGTKWFRTCEKEYRKCEDLTKSPYAECGECKDGYVLTIPTLWQGKKCVEHCTSDTESKKNCTDQKRECKTLKSKPYFECGKCTPRYQEANGSCVVFCSEGTPSEKNCSAANKKCKSQSSIPYFKCDGCKNEYEQLGKACVEYCTNGTSSRKHCNDQDRSCEKLTKKPFYNCTNCFDGYVLKDGNCVKYCDTNSSFFTECLDLKMECYITKQQPFYECKDCLQGYTYLGEKCVEYCTEGTASEKNCTASNRKCHKEQQFPFFKCGSCKTGFIELQGECVAYCTRGTDSEKECTSINRTCEQKQDKPFYSCGKCKQGFEEMDNKCLHRCDEGLQGYVTCNRQNKVCKQVTTGLFYKCAECLIGYIQNGEYCENPCEEEQIGWANCSNVGRECIFNRGAEYRCGQCSNSNWIEDGERCIDPCENVPLNENSTWSEICENSNATCKHSHFLNATSCLCLDKNKIFNLKSKLCEGVCELPFPNEENATWSEVCASANATCNYDYELNKTDCVCHNENYVFNMSVKSCLDPCFISMDGIIWDELCNSVNANCVPKENKEGVTCKCKRREETFDEQSKTCKALHPCDLPDDLLPCKNNGICERVNEIDYQCNCSVAWYGKHCEHKNLCHGNEFCHPATCLMNEEYHSYSCICGDDEYFNYDSKTCENAACIGKTCPLFKECQNGSCVCKKGFEEDNEACKMTSEECEKYCGRTNVKCVSASSGFTCVCKEGYYLNRNSSNCEATRCVFPFHPCQQICNEEGDQLCSCHEGFELIEGSSCEPKQEYTCNETCENGKCLKTSEGEQCFCNDGFESINNSICIDTCSIKGHKTVQSVCPDGCSRENGEIRCICTGKYVQAPDGISCIEKDYCDKASIGDIECQKVGKVCTRHVEKPWYKCVCPEGYREDGETCTDSCSIEGIEECALTHRACKYVDNNETCHCPLSMVFDKESGRCQFADNFYHATIDLKARQTEENMFATDSEENFQKALFVSMKILFGQAMVATDIIDCRKKGDVHTCTFSLIFGENPDDIKNRLKDEHSCRALPNVTEYCIFPPSLVVSRNSLLTATFSNNQCDETVRKQFCPDESNICNPLPPGYTCLCRPGFQRVSTFTLGYDERFKYHTCEDIDECKNNPCWENSKCKNTYGSFTCNCDVGYAINDTKDGCKGVCDGNPCGNNGRCTLFGHHSYKCECSKGYKGKTCMEEDEQLNRYKLSTVLVGSVLGTLLLLTLLSIVFIVSTRLSKSSHKSYKLENDKKYKR